METGFVINFYWFLTKVQIVPVLISALRNEKYCERKLHLPPILTLALDGDDWSAHASFYLPPGKEPLVPIGFEPVWTLRRRYKLLAPAGN
jgi:hypothetical protein